MQDPNKIEDGQFVIIQWAWLVLLYLWYNTSSDEHAHDQSISSRLLRLVHAPIKASVFSNGSRVLSRERSVTIIDTKDTIRDISNLKYDWVSATLLLVCEGVHDELRSMAVTYLSKIHITSWQEIFRKLKYQQIKDMKFSRFRGSVTKHGQTGNLNILQVFLE